MRLLAFALALAACNSSSSSKSAGATTGGNAPTIKACDLLTPAELQQAMGTPMGPGKLQTTDTQASCDWDSANGAVGIIIRNFDANLWDTMSSSAHAKPVTGLGEKAFKGVPHAGDLAVKKGGYEIDVGIVDFKRNPAVVDAAAVQLMNRLLAQL